MLEGRTKELLLKGKRELWSKDEEEADLVCYRII